MPRRIHLDNADGGIQTRAASHADQTSTQQSRLFVMAIFFCKLEKVKPTKKQVKQEKLKSSQALLSR